VEADLYPYSNPTVPLHDTSSFQITTGPEGQGCPSGATPPFHPNLEAGTTNNAAGTYSPFYTHLSRKDSEQEITHFSIKLPPGVIGKLAGVSSCSDAAIAAAKAREREGGGQEELSSPSCPANSEIGHSNVGSGVGNVLAYAPGKLYLAGPYHGSALSIVSITAAKVGPFDLGTVVVRFALNIDHETAEVSVDGVGSDPIPHIVDGIPIHLRDIQAFVDRPNFTLNPTSCKKTSTASTVLGSGLNFASEADDQPFTATSPFQVGSCASLGFKPKLALSLIGGTKRGDTPKLKAVLTARPGDANIGSAQVTLPHSGPGFYALDLGPDDASRDDLRWECFGDARPEHPMDGVLVLDPALAEPPFELQEGHIWLMPGQGRDSRLDRPHDPRRRTLGGGWLATRGNLVSRSEVC